MPRSFVRPRVADNHGCQQGLSNSSGAACYRNPRGTFHALPRPGILSRIHAAADPDHANGRAGQAAHRVRESSQGKTYAEVIDYEVDWVCWVCDHLQNSTKQEHQAFLIYVERYTQEFEQIEDSLLDGEPASRRRNPRPKMSASSRTPGEDPWNLVANASASPDPETLQQVSQLSQRLDQMESLLQQVMGALQQMSVTRT